MEPIIFDAAEAPENVLLRQPDMVPTMVGAAGAAPTRCMFILPVWHVDHMLTKFDNFTLLPRCPVWDLSWTEHALRSHLCLTLLSCGPGQLRGCGRAAERRSARWCGCARRARRGAFGAPRAAHERRA